MLILHLSLITLFSIFDMGYNYYTFSEPESSKTLVQGLVLLNCAGGMNNKAIVDDWRIKLLLPLLWLVDFLLKQRGIASAIFERVKQKYTTESSRDLLIILNHDNTSCLNHIVPAEIIWGTSYCLSMEIKNLWTTYL